MKIIRQRCKTAIALPLASEAVIKRSNIHDSAQTPSHSSLGLEEGRLAEPEIELITKAELLAGWIFFPIIALKN